MSFILLHIDAWGSLWFLFFAGVAGLKALTHELWFWVIALMLAYLTFELIRAHVTATAPPNERA